MYPSGHRGVGAILMLLVLVLSAMALLPALSKGANEQIVGLVSDCASQTTYLGGAQVTLKDAQGFKSPVTVTTANDGTFSFTPSSGSYTLSATRTGYYPVGPTAPIRFDGSVTVSRDLCMDKQNPSGLPSRTVNLTVENVAAQGISGATVDVYNITTGFRFVTSVASNATGEASITVWEGTFQLRTTAPWYAPSNDTLPLAVAAYTVVMQQRFQVIGHAKNPSGQFISSGLTAFLYDPARSTADPWRLIGANVNGSLYDFHAPAGTFTMIVDANNYTSSRTTITIPVASNPVDVVLNPSAKEVFETTVLYGATDWNNLTVYRNLTLNQDSTLAGLEPSGLKDLRLQIDATLGNGNGALVASEATAFQTWLLAKGPQYVTTDAFLLTDGNAYNASASSYVVSVANLLGTGTVWINTSATYGLKTTSWVTYGQPKYFVNVTCLVDSNTTVYHNEVYVVQLPRAYEMVTSTLFPPVTTANYTRITIDPGVPTTSGQTPQVKMVIEKSLNGTARAKVIGPTGKFYVVNATPENYQAYVASGTAIQFSGADSSDPIGDITKANFTWRFEANVSMTEHIGYGIQSSFTYTTPAEYVVNLTVVQAGGNATYRDITIWVDGGTPVGDFKTNLTGTRSATEMASSDFTLELDQDTMVKFDGSLSTDLAYAGKAGVIQGSGYAWDFNGDRITDATGKIVNWTFEKPGYLTVNLTVTDAVGWKGVNATLKLQVNDTEAPKPDFLILDPANDYSIVARSNLVEKRVYTFNASKTTDNYENLSALTFDWTIPGPLVGETGTSHPKSGMNISFAWDEWNNSYAVELRVKDTGFGSGTPNEGNLTTNLTVQVDTTLHPDLRIPAGTLKLDNTNPEEGQALTVTVNVTNKPDRATASLVEAKVYEVSADGASTLLSSTPSWSTTTQAIPSDNTVTLTFQVTVVGQGNKTIKVCVQDTKEPYTWITSENCASQSVVVQQAAWVSWAILGSVVGVIAVFVFFMYYRRKVKSGEWQPRRLRRKKVEGEEKKPRKEKEAKEEKKRL